MRTMSCLKQGKPGILLRLSTFLSQRRMLMIFSASSWSTRRRTILWIVEDALRLRKASMYNAMKTTRDQAEARINGLLEDVINGAKVFQSGGNEISSNFLNQ